MAYRNNYLTDPWLAVYERDKLKARALAAEAALPRLRQQIEQLPWTKSWDFRDELVKKSEVLACLDTLGASK